MNLITPVVSAWPGLVLNALLFTLAFAVVRTRAGGAVALPAAPVALGLMTPVASIG